MENQQHPIITPRGPDQVMRLERLGANFPSRLSFMRSLIRRMGAQKWQFQRADCQLDDNGHGTIIWHITMPDGVVSFVGFATALADDMRTDRVIAQAWDASFTLVSGTVTTQDIERLRANVPLQEAGRVSPRELVLSRANKSMRLFNYVVDCLSEGRQPDISALSKVGYLMRTTAVYGNGKCGLADFSVLGQYDAFNGPFQAEMLIVFMIRQFQFELVNHIAQQRGGAKAVLLSAECCAALGIGNSTGLGMAPYLVRHPILFHHWINARETALARVRGQKNVNDDKRARLQVLLERGQKHIAQWQVEDERQNKRIVSLRRELADLADKIEDAWRKETLPWDALYKYVEANGGMELQEFCVALLIELYPELVDDLVADMGRSDEPPIAGDITLAEVKSLIERDFGWALEVDFTASENQHYFWYYSEAKDEPRLGVRATEPGCEKEMHLGIARFVKAFYDDLAGLDDTALAFNLASYLLRYPKHRLAVRRVMNLAQYPYAEIRDNLLGHELLAIDMLRCKLAFFGATKFDPRSDKWTRIAMYQGAPLIDDLARDDVDDWWLPVLAGVTP